MVTLIGPRVIQRTSASMLTVLGLPDFICETRENYIAKAIEWVTVRRDELNGIRLGLRERFRRSPIHLDYVNRVEEAYRMLWKQWCAKPVRVSDARRRLEISLAS